MYYKMDIIFLKSLMNSWVSFWSGRIKLDFEIEYKKEKDLEIYIKELRLNIKNQFDYTVVRRARF